MLLNILIPPLCLSHFADWLGYTITFVKLNFPLLHLHGWTKLEKKKKSILPSWLVLFYISDYSSLVEPSSCSAIILYFPRPCICSLYWKTLLPIYWENGSHQKKTSTCSHNHICPPTSIWAHRLCLPSCSSRWTLHTLYKGQYLHPPDQSSVVLQVLSLLHHEFPPLFPGTR